LIPEDVLKMDHFLKLFTGPNSFEKEYRKLALKWHPDVSKEPFAKEAFIHIKELMDKQKRRLRTEIGRPWILCFFKIPWAKNTE